MPRHARPQSQPLNSLETLERKKDDQKSTLKDHDKAFSDTKAKNVSPIKNDAKQGDFKGVDKQNKEVSKVETKLDTKKEVTTPLKEPKVKESKSSPPEKEKLVPPLKLHKLTQSPPKKEEKVPPLKISTKPSPPKGNQDQRTVAPLKLGKLPQLKSPKPAEKKPRKRPLKEVQAPSPPVRSFTQYM